ncbi:MAG: SIMPL domain-containing protein [Bacteroidales bacterium]|nr:SIMPL domain-containing protein [Bacteroidales bacterium]
MKNFRIEALIIALGLLALGLCASYGIRSVADRNRTVSVRGLAEREVPADRVIWPLVYKTVGNNILTINADINQANAKIKRFLLDNGVNESEITVDAPEVTDRWANQYNNNRAIERYDATSIITVTSNHVDEMRALMLRTGELLDQGIAIAPNDYSAQIEYTFTGLNDIKPEMIQEATKNARAAAEKFAQDSDSKLGKIKQATQGLFSITDRDPNTPFIKNVRVVTSIDYLLED